MENQKPDDTLKWPQLLCRVISEDYWQRCYVSGYAQLVLPISIGTTKHEISCWRPIDLTSNESKMRDYFLGQPSSFELLKNIGIKDSAIGNVSKFDTLVEDDNCDMAKKTCRS